MVGIPSRDIERQPCELAASISGAAGQPRLAATVRNISRDGARLEGSSVALAPDEFTLTIMHETGATERLRARRVWNRDNAIGVKFLDLEDHEKEPASQSDYYVPVRKNDIGLRYASSREGDDRPVSTAMRFSRMCRSPL